MKAGHGNEFTYALVEEQVSAIIDAFSPVSSNKYRAELPFFHLEPGLWTLSGDGELGKASRSVLRKNNAVGKLSADVESLLLREPQLIEEAARFLVETHFTDSYLEPIFAAIGLEIGSSSVSGYSIEIDKPKRDPKFRNSVLIAWRKQCAMCGYDGELANSSVGLEAAHVKWFSQGGPDVLENGLALCELHHALFDLGVIGISQKFQIEISDGFIGKSESSKRLVYDLHGKELLLPAPNKPMPSLVFLSWHKQEVFRDKSLV
jgi:putative restriction endonuclease